MADDLHLFDSAPFTDNDRRPRRRRKPDEATPTVVANRGWYPIARRRQSVAPFAHRLRSATNAYGATVTVCGLVGRALDQIEPGANANLCPKCVRALGFERIEGSA